MNIRRLGLTNTSGRAGLMIAAILFALAAVPFATAADSAKEFNDCSGAAWCPTMVTVPAGHFRMGSSNSEADRFDDEGPQHPVNIRAFAVGKYDVTRGQYAVFVAATRRAIAKDCFFAFSKDPSWRDPGYPQSDDHPVVCVTWNDAQAYARWLSRRTGKIYRLLTEAEWEYAARAGSTDAFPWGALPSHEYANCGGETPFTPLASGRDKWLYTSPVGSFPPNAFGLYDMHGNVFQWVQDCYADSYAGSPKDGSARDSNGCATRVARGGTWGDRASVMRSAARNYAPPDDMTPISNYRSSGFGFRVARSVSP
jgi:formylglycine-generating enzyme required for sulfatase activity